jgi:hypothetical protein
MTNRLASPIFRWAGFIVLGLLMTPARGDDRPGRDWWAFRPVVRPELPKGAGIPAHPIDAIVHRAQSKVGVTPSPEADRITLIRRLSLDLRGLPPTPGEVDAFLADLRPDAFERLVDAFLGSPAYGERWARSWLDLARYADSDGFEDDAKRPNAWRYRDWVVDALNSDMPFDRFVRLQLAADELAPEEPRHTAALGFLRNGPSVANERTEKVRMDELDDVVSTSSSAFLGLTVGCARCHDHKTDPIPTEDYYRLVAVFAPARFANVPLVSDAEVASYRQQILAIEELLDVARVERLALERPTRDDRPDVTDAEIAALLSPIERAGVAECVARIDLIEASKPRPLPEARGVVESSPEAAPVRILIRGEVDRKGDIVRPGPPRALTGQVIDFPESTLETSTGRRSALAAWISDPSNSLTPRVQVNRIWQGHFGKGLVDTPSDFGATGDAPAIPDLLDWLAAEFVASGWSRKVIHKLIVTSATYRQSSRVRDIMRQVDPDESFLWRFPLRRLDAETIRDSILFTSGMLNPAIGGPGVFAPIDPGVVRTGNIPRYPLDIQDGPDSWRRSLYLFRMRSVPVPLLEVFDLPDSTQSCPKRSLTTTPTQSLSLLNNPFVLDQSRRFAARVAREAGPDLRGRLTLAFRLATGRAPSHVQLLAALDYLVSGDLRGLCHVLFNSNAFIYLD